MLDIIQISKTFNPGTINEKKALNALSLNLKEGDFVTVIGGNGAGKSTLLNAIAGVWPVDRGSITLAGENITGLPDLSRLTKLEKIFLIDTGIDVNSLPDDLKEKVSNWDDR